MTSTRFVLISERVRANAIEAIRTAKDGSRVEILGPRRTLDQNAKLHAMIGDMARQHKHFGRTLSVKAWKVLFLVALRLETIEWIPSLDDESEMVPVGTSTRELLVSECADLIELLYARGAEWGI